MNCIGCLNSDRKMLHIREEKEKECFIQIIKDIPMPPPENLSLYLCWECTALLVRFSKFKHQVMQCYKLLNDVKINTLEMQYKSETRLKTQEIFNVNYKPEEAVDYCVEVIKVESNEEDIDSDIKQELDSYSNDDEKPLIEICKKRKKKKVINGHTKKKNKDVEYTEIELNAEELNEERKCLANREDYVNAMFRCERCITSFPNADDLSDHINLKHERNASLFKCKICECSFSSEVSYNYHKNRHTKRYQCIVCRERFTSKRAAVKHYNLMHCVGTDIDFDFEKPQDVPNEPLIKDSEDQSKLSIMSFPCEFCSKTFMWRTSLRKHLETHRIENGQKRRPYCEPCKLSFTTTSNLQKHVKTSSKHQIQLKLRKLKEMLPAESDSPEKHQAHIEEIRSSVNSARQQYPCCQCGKRFQWRGNLLRHMKSHAAKAKGELVCVPCERTFSSIATYRQHMTVSKKHVSEEEFKFMCSECGKRFANKTRLKDHVDWEHLKNYPHTCDLCQKQLRRKIYDEQARRKRACKACTARGRTARGAANRVFKSHTSLYLHKQVVHKKDSAEHLCDHCGKPFPNQAKLRSHILALHSGAAAYRCGVCGARFAWHSCLSRHVRRAHRKRPH